MTWLLSSKIPNSPLLNQNFYLVWNTNGATFTGAFSSVGSVISPIRASGGSYISFYPAGSVPPGTYAPYGFVVKGATGTFVIGSSITIQDSEIAEPVATIYALIKNNLGATFSSCLITTGWYDTNVSRPQVSVTRGRWT